MGLQELFGYVLGGIVAVLSWIGKNMWDDLQHQKRGLANLREEIATERVHKNDLQHMTDAIFRKLDRIEDKLDSKQDKGHP